jgi:hypothetical protein
LKSLVIRNASWIVTVGPERQIITDGAVAIVDDRIAFVGKSAAVPASFRDRDRTSSSHNVVVCFACGRSFLYKGPSGDDSGRFCHSRCREWFDAGNPPYAPINVMALARPITHRS